MLRDALSDPQRLAGADRAAQEGDYATAALIYCRLANRRPANRATPIARARLDGLRTQAAGQRDAIDAQLEEFVRVESPSDVTEQSRATVRAAFEKYAVLVEQFENLPGFGRELRHHVRRQRSRPQFAAVVDEPEALAWWQQGQEHEQLGSACCAFRAYEKAARLAPAPSGRLAAERLAEMRASQEIVSGVEQCRKLEWCHRTYLTASRAQPINPREADVLFRQIVQRAPRDSEVYKAALRAIE